MAKGGGLPHPVSHGEDVSGTKHGSAKGAKMGPVGINAKSNEGLPGGNPMRHAVSHLRKQHAAHHHIHKK